MADSHNPDSRYIEREIEGTRNDMERTLRALGYRVSPDGLLATGLYYLTETDRGRRTAAALGRLVARHPAPVALMAVGIGWLVYEVQRGRRHPL